MIKVNGFKCLVFLLLILMGGLMLMQVKAEELAPPSSDALQMAGAKGVFAFTPVDWQAGETTWWLDSDGVAPDVAGCHIGTDEDGNVNGRMFGEACLTDVVLVESNPGKGVVHAHSNDTGHPDQFDCLKWCKASGNATGRCEVASAPPCEQSARCVCQ